MGQSIIKAWEMCTTPPQCLAGAYVKGMVALEVVDLLGCCVGRRARSTPMYRRSRQCHLLGFTFSIGIVHPDVQAVCGGGRWWAWKLSAMLRRAACEGERGRGTQRWALPA
eukprot:364253-Chlamydomonas_euryale.AAC.11